MKITIDIPNPPSEQRIIDVPIHFCGGQVVDAGGYGFEVLPKGHGRLIDADVIWDLYHDYEYDFYEAFNDVATIIEADKEADE